MSRHLQHQPALALEADQIVETLRPVEQATMLPPQAFTDPGVFEWELETVFREWICACHISAVDEPGKFVTREIGPDSVLVVGGEDGRPRAFLNVCRHRGARIVTEPEGSVRRRLRCPYHAWSYGLEGELRAAPHMEGVEDFDTSCYGLFGIRVAVVAGLVMVDLSATAESSAEEHVGDLASTLERYRLDSLARAEKIEYSVAANWKAIGENYNECLHCPGVHPELNQLSDYMSGEGVSGDGAWCGGSMTLREGTTTMARERNGHVGSRPAITGLGQSDLGLVFYFVLFPNALVSLHPDYVMLHTLWPRSAAKTEIVCEWLFEPATIAASDFDPGDAVSFWDQVNREDWGVCELTQLGVRSRGFTPGRYSAAETDVHAFDVMVAQRYLEALRETEPAPA